MREHSVTGLAGNAAKAVYADRSGNVWIGTSTGLSVRDGDGVFTTVGPGDEGESGAFVHGVFQSSDGAIWISTVGHGIWRYTNGRIQSFTTERSGFRSTVPLSA